MSNMSRLHVKYVETRCQICAINMSQLWNYQHLWDLICFSVRKWSWQTVHWNCFGQRLNFRWFNAALSNEWEADTFMKHKSSTVMHCSSALRFCTAVLHCSFAPQFKLNFQWTSRGLYYRFSLNYLDCAGSRDQYPGTEEDFVCRTLLLCWSWRENEAWTSRCSSLSSHKRGWIYKMRG